MEAAAAASTTFPDEPSDPADPADAAAAIDDWHASTGPVEPLVQPVVPFRVPGDAVTRQLCATVHLQGSFADHVHDELVEPAHRAMAPNWNIDTLTLARHAEQARQRRITRDLWLLVEFAVVIALAEWAMASFITGRLNALEFGLVALLGLAGTYAAAFAIVWGHYSAVHASAVASNGVAGYDAVEPPPLAPEDEDAISSAGQANVVLFSGGKSPFVGSGTLLDRWALTIDIGTGAVSPSGSRVTPGTAALPTRL